MFSVDLRQELDLLTQVLFEPRHYLEQVDVKVSSIWWRPLAAVPTPAWVEWVAHVRGAPAHYSHLEMKAGEIHVMLIVLCVMRLFKVGNLLTWKKRFLFCRNRDPPESPKETACNCNVNPVLVKLWWLWCSKCWVQTFAGDSVLVVWGSPRTEESVRYILIQSHVGGLLECLPRLLHAARPLQMAD